MSKRVREIWERIKEAPREMGAELSHMAKHGAHELAAALFHGHGFVMYPRGHHDDPQHGLPQEAKAMQEKQNEGREM